MSSPNGALTRADEQLHALRQHEDGTRAGVDPEELHQFRVAIRRLRSLLKNTPWLDPGGELSDELKWLGALTSPVRDLDVLLMRLREDAASFDDDEHVAVESLVAALRVERGRRRGTLNRALSGRRYAALLDTLASLATVTPPTEEEAAPEAAATGSLRKPYRKLAKAVGALAEDPPDDELHALRIRGKKLRYAAETALPTAGKKDKDQLKALVKACKSLQDVLGEHQDAVVAADRVRELGAAHDEPAVAFVAGRLVERELAKRAAARSEWPGAWLRVTETAAALV